MSELVTLVSIFTLLWQSLTNQSCSRWSTATKLKKLTKHSETHSLLTIVYLKTDLISKPSVYITYRYKYITTYVQRNAKYTHKIETFSYIFNLTAGVTILESIMFNEIKYHWVSREFLEYWVHRKSLMFSSTTTAVCFNFFLHGWMCFLKKTGESKTLFWR